MSRVSEYAFINARLRAKIGEISSSSLIDRMIKAPNLVEAVSQLKDTKYSSLVPLYSKNGDIEALELALLSLEIEEHRSIASSLGEKESAFVYVLLEKVEIDNLKSAIRLWYSNVVRHHQINSRANYLYQKKIVHDIDYQRIINATGYDNVLEALKDTPYHSVFSSYDINRIADEGLFRLEIDLDHLYFSRLFSAIDTLSGEDKRISYNLYSVDVDLKNILLFIRYSSYHHLISSSLEAVMIPYGYVYEEIEKKRLFDKENFTEDMRNIVRRKYPLLMDDIMSVRKNDDDMTSRDENARHILMMENFLGNTRKKEFSRILLGKPFSIGITLAYLFLYKDEDRMIRSILSSKFYNVEQSRIREAL